MLPLLLSMAVVCVASLSLGGGVLALCGAREWSWLAPPVGLAVAILIAVPALHVPGRSATTAAVGALLTLAGVVLWVRVPAQRPPLGELATALPVALLVLVPFAASGRAGTLGVSIDNDMSSHLLLAEAYRSSAVAQVTPLLPSYPLGPHALTASLAEGMGIRVDLAFAGLTAAVPVLLAWTAITAVRGARWLEKLLVATVVGIPFLVAAYYGQGSFKELMEATFVLACALILAGFQRPLGWRRWVPFALLCAGAVSVYSLQGLVWPAALLGLWLVGRAAVTGWLSGLRASWHELRDEVVPALIGLGVLVIVLVPQLPRIEKFVSKGATFTIVRSELGNLVAPLSGWEMFGVWNNPNYELPPLSAFRAGMWTAFVLALVVIGGIALMRRGRWMLPLAAAAAVLVWVYANHAQSPYVAAKALVIASPLVLLVAVFAVVQRGPGGRTSRGVLYALLALALAVRVVDSSWEALRFSKVGPTEHLAELRSIRGMLDRQPTLFLGNDDFIQWELAGTPVTPAYYGAAPEVPLRPEKAFAYGQPLDFDTVSAATLNDYDWVITTRDAAASQAPAGLRLARVTRSYELWQRVGTIAPRSTLDEGSGAGATLDCSSAAGRAIQRPGAIAAIRTPPVEVPLPALAPGSTVTQSLTLAAGRWALETSYTSPLPVNVTAPGLKTTLPANLERPGPRWPIGQVVLSHPSAVPVSFHLQRTWLSPASDVAALGSLIAVPLLPERVVPLRQACGKYVDWYRG